VGRTGRIGKKGQYSVILFDKDAKNRDGNDYVFQMLESLKSADSKNVIKFNQRIKDNEQNVIDESMSSEEENKEDFLAEELEESDEECF
jgi:superfamily II DNA/RNA helicase